MAELNDIQVNIVIKGVGVDQIKKISDATSNLQNVTDAAGKSATDQTSKWTAYAKSLQGLERNMDAIFRAASHLQSLGHTITGIGQSISGALLGAADAWKDYEYEQNRAAGALGIFDTQSSLYKELQDNILELGQDAKLFPYEDVAHGLYLWGSATGQTVRNQSDLNAVMQNLLPLMKLSAMTDSDLESSMKGVYQITKQYNLGMGAVADTTEKVFQTAQKTTLEVPDVINAFKMLGGSAATLGIPFETVVDLFGQLGDMGIRGGTAGRGLAQLFNKLVNPTERARKALDELFKANKQLGGSFSEIVFPQGQFVGMAKFIDIMATATKGLNQEERLRIINMMATQNAARVIIPLIQAQTRAQAEGKNILDGSNKSLQDSHRIFEESWKILANSWMGVTESMKRAWEALSLQIGQVVAQIATPLVRGLAGVADKISEFVRQNPKIAQFVTQLLAAVAAITLIVGAMFTVAGVLLAFGAGVYFVAHALGGFITTLTGAESAIGGLGMIGKVLSPIILIMTLLISNVGGITTAIFNLIGAFASFFAALNINWDFVLTPLRFLANLVQVALTVAFTALSLVINTLATALRWISEQKGVMVVISGLATGLAAVVATAVGVVVLTRSMQALWGAIMMMKNVTVIFGMMQTAWRALNLAFLISPIGLIIAGIGVVVGLLYLAWQNNWFGMQKIIEDVFKAISQIAGNIISTIIGVAKNVVGVAAAIPGPWQDSAKALQKTLADLQVDVDNWGEDTTYTAVQAARSVMGGMASEFDHGTSGIIIDLQHTKDAVDGLRGSFDRGSANSNLSPTAPAGSGINPLDIYGGVSDGKKKADAIAGSLPKSITDIILGQKDEFKQLHDGLTALIAGSVSDGVSMAKSYAALAGKDIATGLTSKSTETRIRTAKEFVEPYLENLQVLKGHYITSAKQVPAQYRASFVSNMRLAIPALKKEWKQIAPDQSFYSYLRKSGQLGMLAWIKGQKQQRQHARDEQAETTRRVKVAANLDKLADIGLHGAMKYAGGIKGGRGPSKDSADILTAAVYARMAGFAGNMAQYGTNAGVAFAEALAAQAGTLARESAKFLNGGKTILQFSSPPEAGPWKKIDKWGENAGGAFADGLKKSSSTLRKSARGLLRTATSELRSIENTGNAVNVGGSFDHTRTIKLEITSPDGSVNKRTRREIQSVFSNAGLVSSLEHMATIR